MRGAPEETFHDGTWAEALRVHGADAAASQSQPEGARQPRSSEERSEPQSLSTGRGGRAAVHRAAAAPGDTREGRPGDSGGRRPHSRDGRRQSTREAKTWAEAERLACGGEEETRGVSASCWRCHFIRALAFFGGEFFTAEAGLTQLLSYFQRGNRFHRLWCGVSPPCGRAAPHECLLSANVSEAAADRGAELPPGHRLLIAAVLKAFAEPPFAFFPSFDPRAPFFQAPVFSGRLDSLPEAETCHCATRGENPECAVTTDVEKEDPVHEERPGADRDASAEKKQKVEKASGSSSSSPRSASSPSSMPLSPSPLSPLQGGVSASPCGLLASSSRGHPSALLSAASAAAGGSLCRRVRVSWLAETKARVDALHAASWRSLHAGKWSEVPQTFRGLYALTALLLGVLYAANASAAKLQRTRTEKPRAHRSAAAATAPVGACSAEGNWAGERERESNRRCRLGSGAVGAPSDCGDDDTDSGGDSDASGGDESDESGEHLSVAELPPSPPRHGGGFARLAFRYADLGLIMGGPNTPVYRLLQSLLTKLAEAKENRWRLLPPAAQSPPAAKACRRCASESDEKKQGRAGGSSARAEGRRDPAGSVGGSLGRSATYSSRWGMQMVPLVDASDLSFSGFLSQFFAPQRPVLIRGGAAHWPAVAKWSDWSFLKQKLSDRLLPVEVGRAYTAEDWTQQLIRGEALLSAVLEPEEETSDEAEGLEGPGGRAAVGGGEAAEVIQQQGSADFRAADGDGKTVGPSAESGSAGAGGPAAESRRRSGRVARAAEESPRRPRPPRPQSTQSAKRERTRRTARAASDEEAPVLYMAQHALLEQVPALAADCPAPDFLLCAANSDTLIRLAWIGPAGTVSPAHTDAWQNFFVQVVGTKRLQLFAPDASASLYPFPKGPLTNTSGVPLELFLAEGDPGRHEEGEGSQAHEPVDSYSDGAGKGSEAHGGGTAEAGEADEEGQRLAFAKRRRLNLPPPRHAPYAPETETETDGRLERQADKATDSERGQVRAQDREGKRSRDVSHSASAATTAGEGHEGARESDAAGMTLLDRNACDAVGEEDDSKWLQASFPLFDRKRGLEAVVHPGDILFIPKLWWHFVRAETASVSISNWVD
ncbi:hypothetical protein BESB_055000 [Besnoitia besnoiti]|uniref:JmjC domain-containing protein n=1 Tax=Besnoitia besnoiti TaxID=94643 RepID=A0A2A9MD91_BESBE|nr:hypothetical protein BESB_055000 [Besnoitia besnoiti]PFH35849.1 hypothetical protein BESB_055000 [Besnoitia besnoiti]